MTAVSEDLIAEIGEELSDEQSVFIRVEEGSKGQVLSTPAEIFTVLSEKQGSLILDYENLHIKLPGSAIDLDSILSQYSVNNASDLQVILEVREISQPASITGIDASIVGRVFAISMEIVSRDGKSINVASFVVPVELWISVEIRTAMERTRNVYKMM